MMGVHGIATVLGYHVPEAVPWTAGVGRILLTVGLILLFVLLGKRLTEPVKPDARCRFGPLLVAPRAALPFIPDSVRHRARPHQRWSGPIRLEETVGRGGGGALAGRQRFR
ncbi:DUF2871 family protein [Sorangium sp. So ce124]|uniref:DUF2871 family protein n=1 Tax=Sorangium sp. So ce124 TaxID=3133280 RepID=UPI003F615701